jgi:hypothetical protein
VVVINLALESFGLGKVNLRMTDQATLNISLPARASKPGAETVIALAGTMFSALLLMLMAIYAGPLWRDEVNTANLAQMPSMNELWTNMPFESFPPLCPLLLRGCSFLGLAGGDASIRVLGLYVGLFFLATLWLSARWIGSRAPILSIALLGCLPTFIFIVGANRAYGLASGLLVLCFGTIWRVVEIPSRSRILWAALTCFLFAHCVYYDVVFLCAMLAGGAMVVVRRRQWKTLAALGGIGAVSSATMAVYLPIIHRGSAYVPMIQWPFFSFSTLWNRLGDALTVRSSGELGHNGPEIWLWIVLLLSGSVVALVMQRTWSRQTPNPATVAAPIVRGRPDLALYCVVSMLLGVLGLFVFLFRLHFLTSSWYYVEMLCLCAISLDGLLGASWPALRPWGWLRIGFMVAMMTWGAKSAWAEAHTRRSNVDLIASLLNKNASAGDFIVVQSAWEGITFCRYYHGPARWVTVPPIDSHLVHRTDLVMDKMNQLEPMVPVLREITNTLHGGHSVWLLGNMSTMRPDPPPLGQPWFGTYYYYWSAQVSDTLLNHALQEQVLEIPAGGPVCCLENLPVIRFAGYKPKADGPANRKQ